MNVLIAEDEPLAAERLAWTLQACDPEAQVLEQLDTVKDMLAYIEAHSSSIDLLLLDIQLADGRSIRAFDRIPLDIPVIFTTAYDEYSLDAFRFNSIDYLLKPVQKEDLQQALDKLRLVKANTRTRVRAQMPASPPIERPLYKQRFLVKFGNRMQLKAISDIAYFYAEGKCCYLVQKGAGRRFDIESTLETLSEELLDPQKFFRINRKVIVSSESIVEVKASYNQQLWVTLDTPCDIPTNVSRKRKRDFQQWMDC